MEQLITWALGELKERVELLKAAAFDRIYSIERAQENDRSRTRSIDERVSVFDRDHRDRYERLEQRVGRLEAEAKDRLDPKKKR